MYKYTVEYTDTFGGEANYAWVKRDNFLVEPTAPLSFVKGFAKNLMGLKGVRGTWEDYGDTLKFTPRGSCTVLFVSFYQE
jgi:hypothetical protein